MQYDLTIIGGGLVGAGLAALLRDSTLKIAVIDAREPVKKDPRLFALNHYSCQLLQNMGLWTELQPYATPIREVHVSNQGRFGSVRLHANNIQLSALGHVIPAEYIESAIANLLQSAKNIDFYCPAILKKLNQYEDAVHITIEQNNKDCTLTSSFAVGADGTNSSVRSMLNIATEFFNYQQSAIVTRTRLQRAHNNIAYERFTNDGAIAMLPLGTDESATIWTIDSEKASELMTLSDEVFISKLQTEFGYRLGRFTQITQRFIYPLTMLRAEKSVVQRTLLLGNSAHTLHPVAAQGLNLALYEVASFVQSINEKLSAHAELSTADLLAIGTQIKKQQAISINLSHRLPRLFSNQSIFTSLLLSLGMVCFNLLTPVKKNFIQRLMGNASHMPHLLYESQQL